MPGCRFGRGVQKTTTQYFSNINKKTCVCGATSRTVRSLSTKMVEDPRSAPFHLCQLGTHPNDVLFVEGLRMSRPQDTNQHRIDFAHRPVMLDEIVELFATVPAGTVVDATVGGGGHAAALLSMYPHLRVVGLDRDEVAVEAATERLSVYGDRVRVVHTRFDAIADVVRNMGTPESPAMLSGVLFDLGVSSPQLDMAARGFSYQQSGPLDMRMDSTEALSAHDIVNGFELDELTDLLRNGGEEKFARRVAKAIIAARPLDSTHELAAVVRNAIPAPARRRPGDPAKRTFQAIRIAVNRELEVLPVALTASLDALAPGGRLVCISYHSGEDRIVKQSFVKACGEDVYRPRGLDAPTPETPRFRLLNRGARKPTELEQQMNPRSSSARLRAIEALANEVTGGSK